MTGFRKFASILLILAVLCPHPVFADENDPDPTSKSGKAWPICKWFVVVVAGAAVAWGTTYTLNHHFGNGIPKPGPVVGTVGPATPGTGSSDPVTVNPDKDIPKDPAPMKDPAPVKDPPVVVKKDPEVKPDPKPITRKEDPPPVVKPTTPSVDRDAVETAAKTDVMAMARLYPTLQTRLRTELPKKVDDLIASNPKATKGDIQSMIKSWISEEIEKEKKKANIRG